MAQSQARPPITCHILDTTTGKPAAGVSVSMYPADNRSSIYSARTNSDGRVAAWESSSSESLSELLARGAAEMLWLIRFETGAYYEQKGIKPFFPEVEIRFVVRSREEHYHIPLLLGPYNYTTYRGS